MIEDTKAADSQATYSHYGESSNASYTHSSGMEKDTELPCKRPVTFTYNSKIRRNVNKCIIRFIFKFYNKEELKEYYSKYNFIIDDKVTQVIEEVKAKERCRESSTGEGVGRKDYKKLLRMLMCYKSLRTIVRCSVEALHKKLKDGEYGGIKGENRLVYIETVNNYRDYIDGIEEEISQPVAQGNL
eukprot:TRINITY_DN6626_c0_g1_i1.p1 TRINITY_DN6626_c0_g1~~TRINITY_DN6626_c0_g1_i1.p1  ORF type:complete len:186 (-),score=59.79 TRINITY_DN6626_c0_g1_i1:71-628(-)